MTTREPEDVFDVQMENDKKEENGNHQASVSPDTLRILEAVLFASDELLTSSQLKTILPGSPDAKKIRSMIEKINIQLQKERHPFEIVEIGGGYQFRTISYYYPWVKQIFKEKAEKKLSMQALECLAIIAYKQPISKAEIEAIRGVISDGALKTLLEKRLIGVAGRSDKPGHPLLYSTTQNFLKYFGLNKLEDLPKIEEFEAIAKEKINELTDEELTQPLEEEAFEEVDIEEVANIKLEDTTKSKEGNEAKVEDNKETVSKEEYSLKEETKVEDKLSSEENIVTEAEEKKDNQQIDLKDETIFDLEAASEKKDELEQNIAEDSTVISKEVVEEFDLEDKIEEIKENSKEKGINDIVEDVPQRDERKPSQNVSTEAPIENEEGVLDLEEILTKKDGVIRKEEEAVDLEQIKGKDISTDSKEVDIKEKDGNNSKKRRKK